MGEAHGQMTRFIVDAGVAHAQPPADVEADAATYGLVGGRLLVGSAFGSIYGALPWDAINANWIGGTAGIYLISEPLGPVGLGVAGIASAFTMGDPTPYDAVTGRVTPEARLRLGRSSLRLQGHTGLGRSDVGTVDGGPLVSPGRSPSVTTDLWMYGAGIEFEFPVTGVRVSVGAEAYESRGGTFYTGHLQARGTLDRWSWDLQAQVWETPADPELELSIRVDMPLARRYSLDISGGRAGPDPLLESPANVNGSVVVSWTAIETAGPTPAYRIEGNTVVFWLEAPDAREVSVTGDFSDWKPIALERQGNEWLVRLQLEPGIYHFGFLVDGEWHVPDNAPGRMADEFGRENATLVVPSQ